MGGEYGNVISRECLQTFWGMSPNIPRQTFRVMSWNIPWNIPKYFRKCCQTFRRMSPNIPGNVARHTQTCPQTFQATLVSFKEMRTQGQSKISCCFCVCCKSIELGGRGSPRCPCVAPVMESFSSNLLRAIVIVAFRILDGDLLRK